MPDRSMLSPAERQAIKAELERLQAEHGFSQVELGRWLGGFKQQTMSKALTGDVGPIVAAALYEKLHTTKAELIAKYRGKVPAQEIEAVHGLEGSGLSPNRRAALAAFNWEGVEPAEYEQVHNAIAADYFSTGIDPEPAYWRGRITSLLKEARTKGRRAPVDGAPEPTSAPPTKKAKRR